MLARACLPAHSCPSVAARTSVSTHVPSASRHTLSVLSSDADTTPPSGSSAALVTWYAWPPHEAMQRPDAVSHTLRLLSREPVTSTPAGSASTSPGGTYTIGPT
eukprot:364360-Chlamydomonas_euryale.AAC.11